MKKRLLTGGVMLTTAALALTITPAVTATAATPGGVVVNPDVVYVDGFQGFGTALAWGATNVGTWSDPTRTEIADLLFSEEGLDLAIARYFIGSGQNPNPAAAGCKALRSGADAPAFKPAATTWDWNADPGQRWFLDAAIDRGVQTTEGVFSSPPYWMSISGCTNGNANGALSNVTDANLDDYAAYVADVTEHFADVYNMPFDSITPMNEPDADWWDKDSADHPGTKLTVAQQSAVIEHLNTALSARGLPTKISASDGNHTSNVLAAFNSYSTAAKQALDQVNTHTYHYLSPEYDYSKLTPMRNAATAAGKNLWMSEFGTSSGPYADRYKVTGSLNLGQRIAQDLNELRANGWVFWDGIESVRANRDRYNGIGTSWGLIYADYEAPQNETWEIVKMYYGMAQFSRYIKPGMDIIGTDDPATVAAYDPETGKLVLVVRNDGTSAKSMDYDLSHFNLPSGTTSVTRTSDTLNAAAASNITFDGSELADSLPAKSLTTYVIDGATKKTMPSTVVSVLSDKCMTVNGASTADGATAVQSACTSGTSQQWNLVPVGGGKYQITSALSGKCLSVSGWLTTDGAALLQWTCGAGSANQEWYLDAAPGNSDYLRSALSNKCVSVSGWSTADGTALVQWTCGAGSANQRWQFG